METQNFDGMVEKEKKRKDYACRRQFDEKPSIIPGCPNGMVAVLVLLAAPPLADTYTCMCS